jgi:hypothetical protein
MSLTLDQQHLRCDGAGHDGDGCDATALAPIGLRQRLARTAGTSDPIGSPRDWLFVSSGANGAPGRHFCPLCAVRYLTTAAHLTPLPPLLDAPAAAL